MATLLTNHVAPVTAAGILASRVVDSTFSVLRESLPGPNSDPAPAITHGMKEAVSATLIEALIALAILTIELASLMVFPSTWL